MNLADIKVVMTGTGEVMIENYKGIAEYQEEKILVCGSHEKLLVLGSSLTIDYYSKYDLHILGKIESLQWIG